jgi:hypothetical protein
VLDTRVGGDWTAGEDGGGWSRERRFGEVGLVTWGEWCSDGELGRARLARRSCGGVRRVLLDSDPFPACRRESSSGGETAWRVLIRSRIK